MIRIYKSWLVVWLSLATLTFSSFTFAHAGEPLRESERTQMDEPASEPVGASALPTAPGASVRVAPPTAGGDTPAAKHFEMPPVPEGFSTFDGGWLQIAYHPSLAARVRVLQDQADEVRADLIGRLGREVLTRVHVRVGRTAGEMETLAPDGTQFPKYASGVAYSELGLVLLTAAPRYPGAHHDLPEVFRHELSHIALHDAVSRENVPRWFNEGFAVHASGEAETSRLQALWTAAVSDNLIPFRKLSRGFPSDATTASVAYAQAADMVRFLLRSGEEHRFRALIRRMAGGQTFEQALEDAYSTNMIALETQWRENVAQRYTFWPVLLGGSLIWIVAIGLLVMGYVRRKHRADKKLARWAQEEALEDARHKWAQAMIERGQAVRVLVTQNSLSPQAAARAQAAPGKDTASPLIVSLPTIEHDGQRHTLH